MVCLISVHLIVTIVETGGIGDTGCEALLLGRNTGKRAVIKYFTYEMKSHDIVEGAKLQLAIWDWRLA